MEVSQNDDLNNDPQFVLSSVGLKYATCTSYSDEGIIETIDIEGKPVFLSFKTWFVRPDCYRYEWQDWSPSRGKSENFTVISSNGKQTYLRPPFKGKKPVELEDAIAGATGSSAGGAAVLPRLLMSNFLESTQSLIDLDDAIVNRESSPELGDNFVVEGVTSARRAKCTLQISPEFVLLKATLSFGKVADKELYASYHYKSFNFDQPISDSTFK